MEENGVDDLKDCFNDLLNQAKSIRAFLGNKSYLLDKYLSYLFEGACKLQEQGAFSQGLDVASELRAVCRSAITKNKDSMDHPFFSQAQAYIQTHPQENQEMSTQIAIYTVALAHDFFKYKANEFIRLQKNNLISSIDFTEIKELYYKLSELLNSEEPMIKLNLLFHKRFLSISPVADFIQGLTTDLLYSLIYQDQESSIKIFQLVLNGR
jgi:hypothetical protein